jgi:hypothetical protein
MELYKKIQKTIDKLVESNVTLPIACKLNFTIAYLGEISDDIMEVELKQSLKVAGWMYSDVTMVLFRHKGEMYEAFLSQLKEIAEAPLKANKKFLAEGDKNEVGFMRRDANGRIVGYVKTADILAISNVVKM